MAIGKAQVAGNLVQQSNKFSIFSNIPDDVVTNEIDQGQNHDPPDVVTDEGKLITKWATSCN